MSRYAPLPTSPSQVHIRSFPNSPLPHYDYESTPYKRSRQRSNARAFILAFVVISAVGLVGIGSSPDHTAVLKTKVSELVGTTGDFGQSAKEWWSQGGSWGTWDSSASETDPSKDRDSEHTHIKIIASGPGDEDADLAVQTYDPDLENMPLDDDTTPESAPAEDEIDEHEGESDVTEVPEVEEYFSANDEEAQDDGGDDAGEDELSLEQEIIGNDAEEDTFATTVACTPEFTASLSNPAFWTVRQLSSLSYEIAPKDRTAVVPAAPCLDSAVFSARLVSDDEDWSLIISALPRPVLTKKSGVYSIEVGKELNVPRGRYDLEVLLEFGALPGASAGSPCGADRTTCSASTLPKEGAYVGKQVKVESGGKMLVGESRSSDEDLVLCSSFSPLTGYWEGTTFFPTVGSQPCLLHKPGFPVPFTTPRTTWIHLVGDSNARNLEGALQYSFGSGPGESYYESASPVKNGTVSAIAFRSAAGTLSKHEEPDVIVTWQWWHGTSHEMDANAAELAYWTNGTLADFISRAQLKGSLKNFPGLAAEAATLRPARTYISLGSHSEDLTAKGTQTLIDVLFSDKYVSQEVLDDASVRVFTITSVQSKNIPLDRFARQDLVRNNVIIAAKNEVLRQSSVLAGRILDVEGLTNGITESYMKDTSKKPDAVHFQKFVYDNWSRMIWTDLMGGLEYGANPPNH